VREQVILLLCPLDTRIASAVQAMLEMTGVHIQLSSSALTGVGDQVGAGLGDAEAHVQRYAIDILKYTRGNKCD
jgi:hypothetical protein